MGWETHGYPPAGMSVKEIQVAGQPAFLFSMDEPVPEDGGFHLRFTWGAISPLGETTLSFPPGLKAQIWMLPERLVADRQWITQLRQAGGEEWVGRLSHPHYQPEPEQ